MDVKKSRSRIPLIGAVALSSLGLVSMTGLIGSVMPVANAASTQVTVTYPSANMGSLEPTSWGGQILIDQGTVLQGLFGYNQKNQIVPEIASKWSISNSGRTWTIWLKHGARWSNGKPVTAQDFYYAWLRVSSPSDLQSAVWASVMNNVVNASEFAAGAVPASAVGVKVINPYELRISLTGAVNIEGLLALSASMPLYPPDVKAHPDDWWMPKYFVGDGPYVVHSFVTNGKVELTRNPDYVGVSGSVGNVQQINLIPEPTVPVEDFESGALNAAIITSPSDYQYALTHMKSEVHTAPEAAITYLGWDHSVLPSALNNQLVREAIAMAIDRAPIADPTLNGMVGATSIFAYPGFPTEKYETNPYSYNVKAARELLKKAGYPDGKGIGTLYLYSQTTSSNPQSVLAAESVAEQLLTNLNIRFKVEPTNSTLWGSMSYGGLSKGIKPGYTLDSGVGNWNNTLQWPLQSDQWMTLGYVGAVGSQAFRERAQNWYFYPYDPTYVKAWGSPTDAKLGVSLSSWQPIIKAAKSDIAFLDSWTAKQPTLYRESLTPPGSLTLTQELNEYVKTFSTAKTNAAKHAAWTAFWEWVGTYSTGTAGAEPGLSTQVYIDQHEPTLLANMRMWEGELEETSSTKAARSLSATMADAMIQSGYDIPLYYGENVYLESPNLSDLVPNPWQFQYFYQLQYLHLK